MTISLQTHRESQVLSLSEFKADSYVYAFTLFVKSGAFSGMVAMSHYDTVWLDAFLEQLRLLERRDVTEAVLEDEEGNTISFKLDRLGHVEVSGELREYTQRTQRLDFAFETDQTCLKPFITELAKVLNKTEA
jgi:hypothetical protein